ncbi:Gephyrin [Sphaceloma murrayae]|uniref:Sensitive to high expression protein 9, mitochondrial n=1 Tax=Sphaceloma murrayae TaxID=2082308 RepID=A0A2K1QUW8_9PEZI|nr:Gephyrin [Sphaceloma murrayae]
MSKKLQVFMDDMLAKAAVAGQRLNTYTGTDYSGIENIRRQIINLEQKVKSLHEVVSVAKEAYTTAHSAQSAAQKEVVSLLERKASWLPYDLDRYTSLIRSEHLHEGSVMQAKQKLSQAEKELEEARTELERKERRQYHEEQVWSDTIRRNSTWVTFGLMGLNILLLVANIGIVEPWRRRRLVREVKDALDQKSFVAPAEERRDTVSDIPATGSLSTANIAIEKANDSVSVAEVAQEMGPSVEAEPKTVVVAEEPESEVPTPSGTENSSQEIAVEIAPAEAAVVLEPTTTASSPQGVQGGTWDAQILDALRKAWDRTKEVYASWSTGPLSDDTLVLRKVEVTSIALEGAAVGLSVMGLLMWLIRGSR